MEVLVFGRENLVIGLDSIWLHGLGCISGFNCAFSECSAHARRAFDIVL